VTFNLTDAASRMVVGSCQVVVKPDVPYNVTTTVSCTIPVDSSQQSGAALVTVTPENPGRG